jgi:hypothetical protein
MACGVSLFVLYGLAVSFLIYGLLHCGFCFWLVAFGLWLFGFWFLTCGFSAFGF